MKSEIKVDKISKKIAEILNQHGERWNQIGGDIEEKWKG